MADKIFIGSVSPEGEQMLKRYLDVYMPDAEIVPLKSVGIKGKLKIQGLRPDVKLIILDESMYNECVGVADDVLANSKVHKYIDDDGFKQFLISKFGVLEGVDSGLTPPDQLMEDLDEDSIAENMVYSVSDSESEGLSVAPVTQEDSGDTSAELEDLRTRLAQSEMLVRNLQAQVNGGASDDDVLALVNRIKELETELENSKSGSLIDAGKVAQYDVVAGELEKKKNELREAKEANSQLDYERTKLETAVQTYEAELEKAKTDLAGLEVAKSELEAKKAECDEQAEKLSALEVDLANAKAEIGVLEEKLQTSTTTAETVSDLQNQVQSLTEANENAKADLEASQGEIERLKAEYAEKETALNAKITELEEQLRGIQAELSEKSEGNATAIADKDAEIADLKKSLEDAKNEAILATEAVDVNKKAYDDVLLQKKESDDALVDALSEVEDLKHKLETTEASLAEKTEAYNAIAEQKLTLEAEGKKLESRVASLTNDMVDAKTNEESVKRLEMELLEERRKSARAVSELEVLKKQDDANKTSDLRMEIARLTGELEELKNKSQSEATAELEELQNELQGYRTRVTDLELELADRDEAVKGLSSGVFARLANIAIPKAMYDFGVQTLNYSSPKVVCVCAGSSDSSHSVYSTLRRSCHGVNKRVLVLDVATDSTIDSEFGVMKADSPTNWLSGSGDFKQYIADTRLPNVKVITTALAYLNDLFLLRVDWTARIAELDAFADLVIICFGNLNNTVTKLLFNSFSHAFTTYVITKASPVNLRTAFLNLTGLKGVSQNVTTVCVNFDNKASKDMYQRLANKFKAHILRDADVLPL